MSVVWSKLIFCTAVLSSHCRQRITANKEIEYQSQNLKLQKSLRIPDVSIGTEFDKSANYVNNYSGIGLTMDMPVFNRNQGMIYATKAQIQQAQTVDSLQQNTVKNEVVSAYLKVLKIQSELNEIDTKYNSDLDELIDAAIKNYDKRYISLLEFLDQMRTYTAAQLGLLDIHSDYFKAVQYLNYTTGTKILK